MEMKLEIIQTRKREKKTKKKLVDPIKLFEEDDLDDLNIKEDLPLIKDDKGKEELDSQSEENENEKLSNNNNSELLKRIKILEVI